MKKVKKIINCILKFLGITSLFTAMGCDLTFLLDKQRLGPCMYGMPENYKHVSGVVYGDTDGDGTEEIVEGIQVSNSRDDDVFTTLDAGSFGFSSFDDEESFTITFRDIDGAKNGSFKEQTITVNWSDGAYQKKDVHLERTDNQQN